VPFIADSKSKLLAGVRAFFSKTPVRMVLLLAVAMFLAVGAYRPNSLNKMAIVNIAILTILLSIASAGQTMVLIGGGMDFSVGAVMSSAAVMTTYIMMGEEGHFIQLLVLALGMGALVVFLNGFCTVKIGLPAMIVTMAISNIVSRMQYVLTEGSVLGYPSKPLVFTVTGRLLGGWFPVALMYVCIVFPIVFYLLNYSRYGRQLYLSGSNPVAAALCGFKVNKIRILSYVFSGMLSAFAGILGAAYLNNARCDVFKDYAFNSLIAVIIGGTSFAGGIGSFVWSVAGALLLTVISNSLTILQFSQPLRNLAYGAIMVLLLVTYNRAKRVRQ